MLHLILPRKQARVMNTMFEQFLNTIDLKVRVQMFKCKWIWRSFLLFFRRSIRQHLLPQIIIDL